MRVVALDAVRGAAPGVDVECPVHLLRPCVVVLEGCLVALACRHVQLGDQRARVVGALDRTELVVEEPGPAPPEEASQPLEILFAPDPALPLLRLRRALLVVGEEEEGAVAHDRTAQGEPELAAAELGFSAPAGRGMRRRYPVPLAVDVGGAGEVVRARPGHDVHEPACRASELGRGSLVDHDDLLDGVLIEGEGRTLAAPLLPEEGVVEVGAVDDEIVEDPRCPLTFSSSPSGPWETETPGVSRVRSMKLRPLLGRPSTTASEKRCELVTSSASSTVPGARVTVMPSSSTGPRRRRARASPPPGARGPPSGPSRRPRARSP